MCGLGLAQVYETERRAMRSHSYDRVIGLRDGEQSVSYHRTRYRGSDTPSQSATDTGHYLEIADMPSDVQVEQTQFNRDQQSTSAEHDYDNPEIPYENIDAILGQPEDSL